MGSASAGTRGAPISATAAAGSAASPCACRTATSSTFSPTRPRRRRLSSQSWRADGNQENALKHGIERWGLNRLDGRTFKPFEPDVIITSPARRRLDASLAVLREAEGQLHRKLLRVTRPELRAKLKQELTGNLESQRILEEQRPDFPTHCTVEEAGLHGELMRHDDEYKAVIDTIRTACVNAEADLALELAPAMVRPREAKRLLRNFFSAPGDLRVTANSIEVALDVAATPEERSALDALCNTVNAWKLTHPGDDAARPLRFRTQNS